MLTLDPTILWVGALIVFLIIEGIVPGLVSIWFALGSVAALISSLFQAPLWLQGLWFILVSIASLAATRPLAKKYVNSRAKPTNADMVIGQECIVTETVNNVKGTGSAIVSGKTWTARAEDASVIEAGESATVLRIEGVKLIVRKKY